MSRLLGLVPSIASSRALVGVTLNTDEMIQSTDLGILPRTSDYGSISIFPYNKEEQCILCSDLGGQNPIFDGPCCTHRRDVHELIVPVSGGQ